MYQHWFLSRQKRKLTTILPALVAYSDICVGKVWPGNTSLQLSFEDELQRRSITEHGDLRARRNNSGGGGTRTLFKQLKDLGLVFLEEESQKCRLTLVGESLIRGELSFVDAMRLQLQRYQYPSAAVWSGSGSVDHDFKVHPFQFIFRLLRDPRLDNKLDMKEMYGIVIHQAKSDSSACFEKVVDLILRYRKGEILSEFMDDTPTKTYSNIANTFYNYVSLCSYTDRGVNTLSIRPGKESLVDEFIQENPKFIPNPELPENYQRAYGKGTSAKDLRRFDRDSIPSQKALNESRIQKEYILLALKTPITGITNDIVIEISNATGIDEQIIEAYLNKYYSKGNIDDFFVAYRELSKMGQAGAREFELATCEMFKKIFHMQAEHVGPIGNTPDVFIKSEEFQFCGIIDNKAYKNGYCISGDHQRVMEDVYIPNYQKYGKTSLPLAFYTYIAGSFGSNMNSWLNRITTSTGVPGSGMPVDVFINLAQDYAEKRYSHAKLKEIFSVNRVVSLADI